MYDPVDAFVYQLGKDLTKIAIGIFVVSVAIGFGIGLLF